MIRFWLILLRIICVIQLILGVFQCFSSLIGFLSGQFVFLFQAIAFGLIALLPIFTVVLIGTNFPDHVIAGKQRKNFNRIFLVNFLLIAFLFGFFFKDLRHVQAIAKAAATPFYQLHIVFLGGLLISFIMLVFHFLILYGLYWLRSHINYNASRKQFDFERQNENV
jgi:hypothetical protein